MTVPEFTAVTTHRIPTAPEMVAFATGQRWKFVVNGLSAGLIAPNREDPLVKMFAKMLSREPYRTSVLAHLAAIGAARTTATPREAQTAPAPADPEPERCCSTCATCTAAKVVPVPCAKCQEPLGPKGECWTCHDRPCATCRKPTGSALIGLCWTCGVAEDKAEEARLRGTTSRTHTSASPTRSGTAPPTT